MSVGDADEKKDAVGTDAYEELVGMEGTHAAAAAAADGEGAEAPFCYDHIVIWVMEGPSNSGVEDLVLVVLEVLAGHRRTNNHEAEAEHHWMVPWEASFPCLGVEVEEAHVLRDNLHSHGEEFLEEGGGYHKVMESRRDYNHFDEAAAVHHAGVASPYDCLQTTSW